MLSVRHFQEAAHVRRWTVVQTDRVSVDRSTSRGDALTATRGNRHNGSVPEPASGPSLAAYPCQQRCAWTRTRRRHPDRIAGGLAIFACAGCGSQWVRTQAWTPIDADGTVPATVAREAARR